MCTRFGNKLSWKRVKKLEKNENDECSDGYTYVCVESHSFNSYKRVLVIAMQHTIYMRYI